MTDEPTVEERLERIERHIDVIMATLQAKALLRPQPEVYGPGDDDYGRKKSLLEEVTAPQLIDAIGLTRAVGILPPEKPYGSSKMRGALPDPITNPGAINPDVTVATLKETIGTPGWTDTVRPPVSYTNALKAQKMREYGLMGTPEDYELDHLVPLCCGGHPTDPRNLWPQPRVGVLGARTKDLTEVMAQHAILNGILHLEEVQYGFMHSWVALHGRLFSMPKAMNLMAALSPPEDEP